MVLAALSLLPVFCLGSAPNAEAATVTVCRVDPEEPHDSRHVGGTMNAIGRLIRCVGRHVPDLHMDVQLQKYQNGAWRVVPTKKAVLKTGKSNLMRIGRSRTCSVGTYRTRLRLFGFGRHDVWHYSDAVRITCWPVSGGGSGGGGGGGW